MVTGVLHLAAGAVTAVGPVPIPPNPGPIPVPGLDGPNGPIATIIGWGKWLVMCLGVIGLLICAGQMTIGRRNRHSFAADGAAGIPWVLGGLSLAAISGAIVTVFLS
jgi:hypothetical protein